MEKFEADYSPIEMIKMGVFGGSYFHYKPLKVSLFHWHNHVPPRFIEDLNIYLQTRNRIFQSSIPQVNSVYDDQANYYKVNCGSSYEDWKRGGWINKIDPYGWFNWYINYYYGRRCSDDDRQIKRWGNFKSRSVGMLRRYPESSKIKQNLLHWGINHHLAILGK